MDNTFNKDYSNAYDILYEEKDYDGECDLLENLFCKYLEKPVHNILDLGCGTGNHSIRLAARGYDVTGVDVSESMISNAQLKTEEKDLNIKLYRSNIIDLNLNDKYDVALMMFAVLGYHKTNDEVISALKSARKHLKKSGMLIFDIWYGPAVIIEKPSNKFMFKKLDDLQIIRTSSGTLDIENQTCDVEFNLWKIKENILIGQTTEIHKMRYFFPQEIKLLLNIAGFELLNMRSFPTIENPASDKTWNVIIIAKAT